MRSKHRRWAMVFAVTAVLAWLWGVVPAAAEYPTKPITLTVAYSPGGSTDRAARVMVPFLEKYLGQTVVVLNKPGAGGQVGFTYLARAKPDGYTIGFINIPALHLNKAFRKGVPYHPVKSYAPIGSNIVDPNTVLVRADDDRFKTMRDLVEYARKNPGKLIVGADGPFSDDQLAMVKIEKAFGVRFTYIAYKGGAPSAAALLGGHTDVLITNATDVNVYKGKVRALAQLRESRYEMIAHVPTMEEAMGVKLIGASTRGIAAPAGVPADRLKKLREAFRKAANDPEYVRKAKKAGLTLAWMDAKQFGEFIAGVQNDVATLAKQLRTRPPIKKKK